MPEETKTLSEYRDAMFRGAATGPEVFLTFWLDIKMRFKCILRLWNVTADFDLNEIMKLKIALENCRDAFCRFQGRGGGAVADSSTMHWFSHSDILNLSWQSQWCDGHRMGTMTDGDKTEQLFIVTVA